MKDFWRPTFLPDGSHKWNPVALFLLRLKNGWFKAKFEDIWFKVKREKIWWDWKYTRITLLAYQDLVYRFWVLIGIVGHRVEKFSVSGQILFVETGLQRRTITKTEASDKIKERLRRKAL